MMKTSFQPDGVPATCTSPSLLRDSLLAAALSPLPSSPLSAPCPFLPLPLFMSARAILAGFCGTTIPPPFPRPGTKTEKHASPFFPAAHPEPVMAIESRQFDSEKAGPKRSDHTAAAG